MTQLAFEHATKSFDEVLAMKPPELPTDLLALPETWEFSELVAAIMQNPRPKSLLDPFIAFRLLASKMNQVLWNELSMDRKENQASTDSSVSKAIDSF